MDLVVDSELLQPYQAVKTVFVHCTWYRRCIWTPHINFNKIHDIEFLPLFEPFACFPNNVGQAGTAKNRDGTRDKTGQSRKGRSKTEKGCSKTEKDVLKQERMF